MDRHVRPRVALPEHMEETDQHPWLMVEATPEPDNFSEDYIVLSVPVGTMMTRLLPGMEIPYAYSAVGFAIHRNNLGNVSVLEVKKMLCELVWTRCRLFINLGELALMSDMAPWPSTQRDPWSVPNNISLLQVREGNPQPRNNLGSSWPVFVLGREDQQYLDPYEKIESPTVYMARPGVEIQFLTTQLNPVLTPRSQSSRVSLRPRTTN